MKTLLIDNGTIHLDNLEKLAISNGCKTTKVSYEKIPDNFSIFDLIILSGSSKYSINSDIEDFEKETEIIRSGIPIIGVCFGFELIVKAFGQQVVRRQNKIKGIFEINPVMSDPIIQGLKNIRVFEAHRFYVESVKLPLIEIARSEFGVEIVKHNSLPIYGMQFHPESLVDKTQGHSIFENILETLDSN